MTKEDDDWSPEEAAAWRMLGGGASAPAELEGRLVEALRREGLLQPRSGARRRALALVGVPVAAGVLFASGVAIGRMGHFPALPPDRTRFVLFLHPGTGEETGETSEETDRVQEYAAWAAAQRGAGRLEGGARLEETAVALGGEAPVTSPQGYFILRASGLAEAVEIARSCPHLRRGGILVVRPMAPKV